MSGARRSIAGTSSPAVSALFGRLEEEGIFRLADHIVPPADTQVTMERTTP